MRLSRLLTTARRARCAALVLLLPLPAVAQSDAEVRAFSERYARLVLAQDFKAAAALNYDGAVRRAGGVGALEDMMRRVTRNDAENGLLATDDRLGPMQRFTQDGSTVFLVEATRFIPSFPAPIELDHLYVVSRSRTTQRLEMLDLGCVSVDWVEELAPGFRDSPLAAELVRRELLAPASAR